MRLVKRMIVYKDKKYQFYEYFNEQNGFLFRSDSMHTNNNPKMRSFPELLDVGIMGTCLASEHNFCKKFGVDCYQKATIRKRPNMNCDDYERLLSQCTGKVFQIALGGAGDPNKHEYFEKILKTTCKYKIIPNYTTSGYLLSDYEAELTKMYCGAVAVSFYSNLIDGRESNQNTIKAINIFLNHGCTTNIHYVLSKDTISEAIFRLKNNLFPQGINAVIFLLYKPSGFGILDKTLSYNDLELKELIDIIDKNHFNFDIGFDTCFTPALISFSNTIAFNSIDFCEAARFSMYIDCELNAYPCSFDAVEKQYCISLKESTIPEIWNSEQFNQFRRKQESNCIYCKKREYCLGGCTLYSSIDICNKKNNSLNNTQKELQ